MKSHLPVKSKRCIDPHRPITHCSLTARPHFATAPSYPQIDKTGKNACQLNARRLPSRWRQYYAALNARDWEGGRHCGKCLKVKGRKGTVIVKVVDLCPAWACPKKTGHSVDLSADALGKATGYYWDRKPISWDFIKCPQ